MTVKQLVQSVFNAFGLRVSHNKFDFDYFLKQSRRVVLPLNILWTSALVMLIFNSCGVATWVKCLIFQESRAGFANM